MGQVIPLQNYPTAAWGATRVSRGDFFGSNSYQQGGEVQTPIPFGFAGGIEEMGFSGGGYSASGTYFARVAYPANSFSASELKATSWGQNASSANNTNAPVVKWFYAANSVEVANNTNLAAEVVRYTSYGG